MAYPVENLFRKPVEFLSVSVSVVAVGSVLVYHDYFGFSLWVTGVTATSLAALAYSRFRQGLALVNFQMGLRWLPKYELASADIPWSPKEMFIGMGFWWGQQHTQRLYQARHPDNKHLKARSEWYEWARDYERKHPQGWLTQWTRKTHKLNPVSPLPPVGGDPAIHGIEPNERQMWAPISERVGHTLVLGTTRVGKTRLAEILITQDIRRGNVVIVFDPKGDVALLKRMYAEAVRAGRGKDFWFFHLGYPELSDRYSPISSIGRITEVATRVTNPLPGDGNSAAFKEFAWLYVNIIARAAAALGMQPTYSLIYQYAADLDGLATKYLQMWLNRDHRDWGDKLAQNPMSEKMMQTRIMQTGRTQDIVELMDLIQTQGWHEPIADGLLSVLANNKSKYQALVNSLFPLLEKLTTGKVNELLSPNYEDLHDKRRLFDWDKIMDTGGIVYIGLDSLSDFEVAAAVGNATFGDLTSTAGRRYKFGINYGQSKGMEVGQARKVSIHADEFNELIGDEFIPLVNKAGGAGYEVTAYTQTWSDVEAKIGNKAKAEQIGGNFNTMIMLRVKNMETAELLTKQLPKVEIYSSTMVSGANDVQDPDQFADFSAGAQDRLTSREVEMLSAADVVQLPKGQAFALLDGGQLAKLRLPLPVEDSNDAYWPSSLNDVFSGMHAQYTKYIQTVEQDVLPIDFQGNTGDELTVEGKGHGF